jgi:glycosyltransferase involved in cell wall biosynthesis
VIDSVTPTVRRVAIVTPWYGPDLKGGAEQQARELAVRLSLRGVQVDVLTTCSHSFLESWQVDHFEPGIEKVSDTLSIRRFTLNARDEAGFARVNASLLANPKLSAGISPVSKSDEDIWVDENINSKSLEDYLSSEQDNYDCFIFLPYLYGVILNGLRLVAEKAWLMPCLHDEAYAYLSAVSESVQIAKGLLFISEGEQLTAARIFGPTVYAKGTVVGAGVEPIVEAIEKGVGVPPKYILCLGRRSPEKGTDALVAGFQQFRLLNPQSYTQLVLAGPGNTSYQADGVHDLGLVDDQTKANLLRGCRGLFQPSNNESFSRVIYEAWFCSKPVVVSAKCDATSIAVERSGGGWVCGGSEWSSAFQAFQNYSVDELKDFGRLGEQYYREVGTWDASIDRVIAAIIPPNRKSGINLGKRVIQLLPNLAFGDAISNEAILFRDFCESEGYESVIMVRPEHIDSRVAEYCEGFDPKKVRADDLIVYHHSIGSEMTSFVVEFEGIKCMIYHNITPPEVFAATRPDLSRLLRDGLEEMWALSRSFSLSYGDSKFNANDLERFGFEQPKVLPIPVDPSIWDCETDEEMARQLTDGSINIVFVGRYSPNKRQVELVEVLQETSQRLSNARLVLAGFGVDSDPYVQSIKQAIGDYGLGHRVLLTGHLTLEELKAVYMHGDVFLSLSEHEGFGVPLLEAMWFDLPVVAINHAAVAETLDGAGLLLDWNATAEEIAACVCEVLDDGELRESILRTQRQRRIRNKVDELSCNFTALIDNLVALHD